MRSVAQFVWERQPSKADVILKIMAKTLTTLNAFIISTNWATDMFTVVVFCLTALAWAHANKVDLFTHSNGIGVKCWRVQELHKIDWTCSTDVWARVTICITRGNRRLAFSSHPRTARPTERWPQKAKKGQNWLPTPYFRKMQKQLNIHNQASFLGLLDTKNLKVGSQVGSRVGWPMGWG